MFIKKITNRKSGKIYITYRLVKSKRIGGVPKHVSILELGSLAKLPTEKHKTLADRIDQLLSNQLEILSGLGADSLVEEYAQYYFRKLVQKQLEPAPVESEKPDNKEMVEVDLNSFETLDSKQIGGEWLCYQAFEELGLASFVSSELGFNKKKATQLKINPMLKLGLTQKRSPRKRQHAL
jgi:hypothetical protein